MFIAVYVRNTCTYNVLNISSDSCVCSPFLLVNIPSLAIHVNNIFLNIISPKMNFQIPPPSSMLKTASILQAQKTRSCLNTGFPLFLPYSNSQNLVWFRLFQYGYLYCFVLIFHIFSTHYFSFHIFLVPIQYHCIFSLLCVVPVACRFVYYSQNNILSVCKSTHGNYNLRTMFLQLEILRY